MQKDYYDDDDEDKKDNLAQQFSKLHIPKKNLNKRDETLMLVGRRELWKNKSSTFFNSDMVVYEISCKCECFYYGETSNSLRVALGDIESKIKSNSSKKRRLVEHFGNGNCNFDNAYIKIKDYEECTDTRRQKKRGYINKCCTSLNKQKPKRRDIGPHNLKQEK